MKRQKQYLSRKEDNHMPIKRKAMFIFIYISIIIAMLFMFFYVQKRYGHTPTKKRTERTDTFALYHAKATALHCDFRMES